MTVYVDELRRWGFTHYRCFGRGSCHLTPEPGADLEELHALAARIGLRRAWFQPHPVHPHYDLTPSRREAALLAGAVYVPAREQAARRLRGRHRQSAC